MDDFFFNNPLFIPYFLPLLNIYRALDHLTGTEMSNKSKEGRKCLTEHSRSVF